MNNSVKKFFREPELSLVCFNANVVLIVSDPDPAFDDPFDDWEVNG